MAVSVECQLDYIEARALQPILRRSVGRYGNRHVGRPTFEGLLIQRTHDDTLIAELLICGVSIESFWISPWASRKTFEIKGATGVTPNSAEFPATGAPKSRLINQRVINSLNGARIGHRSPSISDHHPKGVCSASVFNSIEGVVEEITPATRRDCFDDGPAKHERHWPGLRQVGVSCVAKDKDVRDT